jgi:hypothetical protein
VKRIFDRRVEQVIEYSCMKDIKHMVIYYLDLPFVLGIDMPYHEMTINNCYVEFLQPVNRFITFFSEKKWQDTKDLPGKTVISVTPTSDGVRYTSEISKVCIFIEIKDDEYDNVYSIFKADKDQRAILLHNIMYILRNKLTEIRTDTFDLDVSQFGAERVMLLSHDNSFETFEADHFIISPKYKYKKEYQLPVGGTEQVNGSSVIIWRYYAKKCEIAFNEYQNLDCILFAGITFESYASYLLHKNGLYDKYYSDNVNPGFFDIIKYLKQENAINKERYILLKGSFGQIKDYRNDVVHGKINSIMQERNKAIIAYNSVVTAFSTIQFENSIGKHMNIKAESENMNELVNKFRNKDYSCLDGFKKNIVNNIFVMCSTYYIGLINYYKKDYDEASKCFEKCCNKKRFFVQSLYNLCKISIAINSDEKLVKFANELNDYINSGQASDQEIDYYKQIWPKEEGFLKGI